MPHTLLEAKFPLARPPLSLPSTPLDVVAWRLTGRQGLQAIPPELAASPSAPARLARRDSEPSGQPDHRHVAHDLRQIRTLAWLGREEGVGVRSWPGSAGAARLDGLAHCKPRNVGLANPSLDVSPLVLGLGGGIAARPGRRKAAVDLLFKFSCCG